MLQRFLTKHLKSGSRFRRLFGVDPAADFSNRSLSDVAYKLSLYPGIFTAAFLLTCVVVTGFFMALIEFPLPGIAFLLGTLVGGVALLCAMFLDTTKTGQIEPPRPNDYTRAAVSWQEVAQLATFTYAHGEERIYTGPQPNAFLGQTFATGAADFPDLGGDDDDPFEDDEEMARIYNEIAREYEEED